MKPKSIMLVVCPAPYLAQVTELVNAAAKRSGHIPLVLPDGCVYGVFDSEEDPKPEQRVGFKTGAAMQLSSEDSWTDEEDE